MKHGYRLCTRCGENERSGKDCRCKQCKAVDRKQWELENPEKAKLAGTRRMERYRSDPIFRANVLLKHRERYAKVKSARLRARRINRYKITPQYYDAIERLQQGKCAICERSECQSGQSLAIDHNHFTGVARGFLCMKCNHGIGCFYDNPDYLRAAADYLEAYKLQEQVA